MVQIIVVQINGTIHQMVMIRPQLLLEYQMMVPQIEVVKILSLIASVPERDTLLSEPIEEMVVLMDNMYVQDLNPEL